MFRRIGIIILAVGIALAAYFAFDSSTNKVVESNIRSESIASNAVETTTSTVAVQPEVVTQYVEVEKQTVVYVVPDACREMIGIVDQMVATGVGISNQWDQVIGYLASLNSSSTYGEMYPHFLSMYNDIRQPVGEIENLATAAANARERCLNATNGG